MAEKRQVTLSGEEVASAARKLQKFGMEQLTLNEQMVLDWLLQRAASAPVDDPEGDVRSYLSAGQRNPARARVSAQVYAGAGLRSRRHEPRRPGRCQDLDLHLMGAEPAPCADAAGSVT